MKFELPLLTIIPMTLNQETDIDVVGEGGTCDEAVLIATEHLPDLALLDVSMPGADIEAAHRIAEIAPAGVYRSGLDALKK
jgi:two-component system nitrate/nitrite response regulator NarL